jgi:uncharacterized membrane protein
MGECVILSDRKRCAVKKKTEAKAGLTERITVRVSPDVMKILEREVEGRGLVKVSDLVRIALHDAFLKKSPNRPA